MVMAPSTCDVAILPLEEDLENHQPGEEDRFADPIGMPATAQQGRILWPYLLAVGGFHLLLPLAFIPWLFSWTGLTLIPVGNYLFCSLGIGAGYHRLLTHRSFQCSKWNTPWRSWVSALCKIRPPAG
jgi:fatty-acid desaturase